MYKMTMWDQCDSVEGLLVVMKLQRIMIWICSSPLGFRIFVEDLTSLLIGLVHNFNFLGQSHQSH